MRETSVEELMDQFKSIQECVEFYEMKTPSYNERCFEEMCLETWDDVSDEFVQQNIPDPNCWLKYSRGW
jgi:hypothetical protein